MTQYEQSLKEKWDWYSCMKTVRDEGKQELAEKIAKNLKDEGHSIPYIAKMTGLTEEEIKKL